MDVTPQRITFSFLPNQRVPKQQCDEARGWLEDIAARVAGTKVPVSVVVADQPAGAASPASGLRPAPPAASEPPRATDEDLRQQAMSDPAVQALLEIFPVEKTKVEEIP